MPSRRVFTRPSAPISAGLAAVLAVFVLLTSCHRADPIAAARQEHAAEAKTVFPEPPPRLTDGFEGPKPADFWLAGDYGAGRFEKDAISMSTTALSGRQSVEVTVREGAIAAPGDGDTQVERAELDSGHFALLGRDAWYAFAFYVPENFPIVDTRLVIGSCKQSDVPRPITGQRFRNGKHTYTVESHGQKKSYTLPPIKKATWVRMVYHMHYAADASGRAEVWMDGRQVVDYKGPTAEDGFKNAFYHKIGIYRDRMAAPMTMLFDDYTFSLSKDDVAAFLQP